VALAFRRQHLGSRPSHKGHSRRGFALEAVAKRKFHAKPSAGPLPWQADEADSLRKPVEIGLHIVEGPAELPTARLQTRRA